MFDQVPYWTRQLALLRARADRRERQGAAPGGEIVGAALDACDSLLRELAGARTERDRLRAEVRTSSDAWEHLFDVTPTACLLTDSGGFIVNANRSAGALLGMSAKRLRDRELVVFSEDRAAFGALLKGIAANSSEELRSTLRFRPRERKPLAVDVVVVALTAPSGHWLWFLTPAGKGRADDAVALPSTDNSLSAAS